MATAPEPTTPSLELLFASLLAAYHAGDMARGAALWKDLEAALTAHVRITEKAVVDAPPLRPNDARLILQEHRHLQARLRELTETLHALRRPEDRVRTFVDEVRAHLRHEAALLGG